MSAAIPITRLDHTASELRNIASKCDDGAQVRRLLALALVLEGCSRAEAAAQNGMDCQSARKRDPLSASKRDPGVSACAGSR